MTPTGRGGFDGVLVRGIGAVLGGFAVMFVLVMTTTWFALLVSGLGPEDGPTTLYLALNLAGSLLAAVAGGVVARRVGRSPLGVWVLAGALAVMGVTSALNPAQGQPGWYPAVIAVIGVGGILVGGLALSLPSRPGREVGPAHRVGRRA